MARQAVRSKSPTAVSTKSGTKTNAGRLAVKVDPAARAANLLQLRRASGQLEGIKRMIEDDRYCADIIVQITAARASLQVIAKSLLHQHLKACHEAAIKNGAAEADAMYQELIELVARMTR
jgi:DNA-binding FrmR family transcriptional regulator